MKTTNIRVTTVKTIYVAAVFFGGNAYADEVTLCQSHEEVYFSCPTEGKVISVCASGNISPDNGYVQYRFGTPDRIELQSPGKPYPPRNRFSMSEISEGNINFTHLKFKCGKYDYVVYQGFPSGIYIKKGGKLVSNRICEHGSYQKISPRALRGIETVAPIDGIDN